MRKKSNESKKRRICPVCAGRRFVTSAHIVQSWVVDECGNFQEVAEDCVEVTHEPDPDNTWTCQNCGAEAVDETVFFKKTDMDLNDVVIECHAVYGGITLCGQELDDFYIALWQSDDSCESENCDSVIGYSVYDDEHELVDGGEMEYDSSRKTVLFATDMIFNLLSFIFEKEYDSRSYIRWKLSSLDRYEDFDE